MNCPICQKSFIPAQVFQFPAYDILTCENCGARFCHPLTYNNINFYNTQYMQSKPEWFNTVRIPPNELKPYLSLKNKNILDIGCGNGSYLNTLRGGNQIMGLEISKDYEPFLMEKGIPHKIGDLSTNLKLLPDSSFDLITLWDVFEHLENPVEILGLAKIKLAPKGVIVNWTNNYDDWISRFAEITYLGTFGILKTFLEQSFNRKGGHNFNFIPKSLSMLYQKLGLRVVETVITDTPSYRLTRNIPFRLVLEVFYLLNKLSKKGKIVCHVVTKDT